MLPVAMTRLAVVSVTLAGSIAASAVPVCAASAGSSGKVYTAAHVSRALQSVFHIAPRKVLLGSGDATFFAVPFTDAHHFTVSATVYRSPVDAVSFWKGKSASWRYSGHAIAKVKNVIFIAGPVDARLGVKGRPFPMPTSVERVLRLLVNGH